MLEIDAFKITRGLQDSEREFFETSKPKIYYTLYDSDKISNDILKHLIKNQMNEYYDEIYLKYKDYFFIITEEQYNNLLKGRLKRLKD